MSIPAEKPDRPAASGGLLDRQVIHEVQTQNGGGAKTMPDEAPGAGSDILVSNGNNIYMRDRKLNFKVELKQSADDYVFPVEGPLNTGTNFFDQHWFHRTAWRYGKTNGYMIAFNANSAWSVFTYKTPGSGQHKLYVPRGGDISMIPDKHTVTEDETGLKHLPEIETDGFLLTKRCVDKSSVRNPTFPIGAFTMVLTENKFLTAGFIDIIIKGDPWARIEGRREAAFSVLSQEDGKKLAEYPLETLPVWNGMVAANEKVFVSLRNGKLVCFGKSQKQH